MKTVSDCLAPPAGQVMLGGPYFSPAALDFLRRDLHDGEGRRKEAHVTSVGFKRVQVLLAASGLQQDHPQASGEYPLEDLPLALLASQSSKC